MTTVVFLAYAIGYAAKGYFKSSQSLEKADAYYAATVWIGLLHAALALMFGIEQAWALKKDDGNLFLLLVAVGALVGTGGGVQGLLTGQIDVPVGDSRVTVASSGSLKRKLVTETQVERRGDPGYVQSRSMVLWGSLMAQALLLIRVFGSKGGGD